MNNVTLVRTLLEHLPAAERAQLAREVKEGLQTIDEMLKPQRSTNYVELETPCYLSEDAVELAMSKMPPSTQYTLHVSPDSVEEVKEWLSEFPDGYARAFAPRVELKGDARDGEWWIENRLTGKSVGSFMQD